MDTKYKNRKIASKSKSKKWLSLAVSIVIVLGAIGVIYLLFIREDTQPKGSGVIKTATQKDSSASTNESTTKSNTPSVDETANNKNDASASPNTQLKDAPTGTFISNHTPNLSGSPAPSEIQSTCSTVPGASCLIRFVKGDIIKTLPEQVADADGTVSWSWDVRKSGFTEGSWEVTAIARLNNQSKETKDNRNLEIKQ